MGWRDDLRGELEWSTCHSLPFGVGVGRHSYPDKCGPVTTLYGQNDVEGVLCDSLQSHDVEETAIPCNLVGRVGVPENQHFRGWIIRFSQVELHSCTAHRDVSGAQFSGGSSDVERDYAQDGEKKWN